ASRNRPRGQGSAAQRARAGAPAVAARPRREGDHPLSASGLQREVLVTGGGRGIGRAIALRFAEAGARVFVNFFVNREAAEKTARDVELRGGSAHVVQADLKELTRYLAVELGAKGITVNAVSGGAVATDVWHMIPDGQQALEAIRARTPGNTLVTPEAIADVVFFLASPAAQFIQGQVLAVDGGYSLLA